jgi:exonuclease SbcC
MLILQVELENIKSYERAVVMLQPGVNAIVGHNGAGKSTILEAIGFALFDSLPYKSGDFLREGTRTGMVTVTFAGSLDERPYRVERRLGGSHLYVVYDVELGAKLCEGKTDVLAFVRRQVGAEPTIDLSRLFADAIGVPQGTLTAAFLQAPAQRKLIFDALLQVDEYRTAVDKLREPRTVLAERQQALAQEIAVLSARLERLPQLEAAVAERTQELQRIAQTLAALGTKLEALTTRKQALEALRAAVEQCERERMRQGEQVKTIETQTAEAQRLLAAAEAARALVTSNLSGHDLYIAAQARRSELDKSLRARQALHEARAAADKQLALAQSELQRSGEQMVAIRKAEEQVAALGPAVARQEELERELAAAQSERARLLEAARNLATEQKRVQELQAREKTLGAQLGQAETQTQQLRETEHHISELQAAITARSEELGTVQATAGELKQQNELLASVLTALCPVCEQPLSDEHRRRVIDRNEQRIQALRGEYMAAKTKLGEAEAELKQATAQQRALAEKLRSLPRAGELVELRPRITEAEQAVAAAAAAAAGVAAVEQRTTQFAADLAALQNPRQQLALAAQAAAGRPALEARAAQYAQQQAAATAELARLEQALAEFHNVDKDLAEVESALQQHQAAFQAVLTNRQQAESLDTRRSEHLRLQTAAEQARIALADIENGLRSLQTQFDPVEYAGILSNDQALRSEMAGLETRQTLFTAEQVRANAEIEALRALRADLTALAAGQEKLGRQSAVLETVRTLLRQSGPYITQALIRQISAAANQIFGELMQDFSRELCWSEDYGITLEVEGASRQFVQLSGGEQMSAALAVRLALVREISNIDIAFFDEPTANLDDVRREALARQVMNIRGFRQLFVISHDDTFEQVTQNLIRVKRHGSSSIVAPIES